MHSQCFESAFVRRSNWFCWFRKPPPITKVHEEEKDEAKRKSQSKNHETPSVLSRSYNITSCYCQFQVIFFFFFIWKLSTCRMYAHTYDFDFDIFRIDQKQNNRTSCPRIYIIICNLKTVLAISFMHFGWIRWIWVITFSKLFPVDVVFSLHFLFFWICRLLFGCRPKSMAMTTRTNDGDNHQPTMTIIFLWLIAFYGKKFRTKTEKFVCWMLKQ